MVGAESHGHTQSALQSEPTLPRCCNTSVRVVSRSAFIPSRRPRDVIRHDPPVSQQMPHQPARVQERHSGPPAHEVPPLVGMTADRVFSVTEPRQAVQAAGQ